MSTRRRLSYALLAGASIAIAAMSGAQTNPASTAAPSDDGELLEGFRNPPMSARPQVWWHWMSGNVSAEGAKLDLEWMRRIGIGGIHAFSGGGLEPTVVEDPKPFMSPGWIEAFSQSVAQARAAGMSVTIAGSPGWSQTGGPWVAPSDGMKKYVWSETVLLGGRNATQPLADLPNATGAFQAWSRDHGGDKSAVAHGGGPVVAMRLAAGDAPLRAKWVGPLGPVQDLSTSVAQNRGALLPMPRPEAPLRLDADLGGRTKIEALTLAADPVGPVSISVSDDGRAFREIGRYDVAATEHAVRQQTFRFAPASGRFVRLSIEPPAPPKLIKGAPPGFSIEQFTGPPRKTLELRRLTLHGSPRVSRFEAKAGFQPIIGPDEAASLSPRAVAATDVVDLTDRVDGNGVLHWKAPPGRWLVLRFGWSLTGQTNGPAEASATGLESDKLDPAAMGRYIDGLFALYSTRAGVPLGSRGLGGLLTDSWEAGVQNWTPSILADFRRLRGYDPMPWLPVLTGRVVRDTTASDAFLFDWRRTLKDLLVANHYALLRKAAHARGMEYYTEVQGDAPRGIIDGLEAKLQADVPAGEFWYRAGATDEGQPPLIADLREAASAAHISGRPIVAAESLTVGAGLDMWGFSPAMLKPVVDQMFALGVNRIWLHESHHQPYVDRKPGLSMGFIGQFFNRNETWAEDAKPWIDYLARTSFLLQQGRDVADVAYLYGEERPLTEIYEHRFETEIPAGYGFDYMDAGTLRNSTTVNNGALVTKGGATYRVIFLGPEAKRLTQETLERLTQLVQQGATLVGARPTGRLGMAGNDRRFAHLVSALWGTYLAPAAVRQVGLGRVAPTGHLSEFLASSDGFKPDVGVSAKDELLWRHRRTTDADIFYVTNRRHTARQSTLEFRSTNAVPRWWSPDDGSTRPLAYRRSGGMTQVDLSLAADEAGFVVFQRSTVTSSTDNTPAPASAASVPVPPLWTVDFVPAVGRPFRRLSRPLNDWSRDADPTIRYFSGSATYSATVHIEGASANKAAILDLGDVRELADVVVNGKRVGTRWHAPYTMDITGYLQSGSNDVSIRVVNLWVNRLIGDKQPGAEPLSYAPSSTYLANSPLRPSGLLGPVTITVGQRPSEPTRWPSFVKDTRPPPKDNSSR